MKWKIAALTLITWPLAIWFVGQSPYTLASKFLLGLASLPLVVAVCIELYARLMSEKPDSYVGGSAVGNQIAGALALALIGLVLFLVYRGAT